jgi:hypothetical protein
MPVVITNLSLAPIFVPLSRGGSLRLSPGKVSDTVPDIEVKDNPKIDKLLSQRVISIESQSEGKAKPAEGEAPEPDVEGDGETRSRTRKKG